MEDILFSLKERQNRTILSRRQSQKMYKTKNNFFLKMPLRLKFYRKGIFQCIPFKKYIFSGLRTKNKRGERKVFVSFDGLSI